METIDIAFGSGTWWLYALVVIVAIAGSVYTYRSTIPPLQPRIRLLLSVLRAIGLSALMLTLFEPLLRMRLSETLEPRIAIAIDVSRSMSLNDRSVARADMTKLAYDRVLQRLGDRADVFVFDGRTRPFQLRSSDSLRFEGYRSDIGGAIRSIANVSSEQRYGSVVLITDGNHNDGEQPLYIAERSGVGVYSVGIGDTLPPADVRVNGILGRGLAIAQQPVPISVDLEQLAVLDGKADLLLKDNNQLVERQSVTLSSKQRTYRSSFTWTPTTEGIHKLSAEIVWAGKEFTKRNNVAQTFVRVQKNKRRVLLVAGSPSADVTFIRSAIEVDPTIEVITRIQKDAATFYEGPLDLRTLSDIQALVLVGFPTITSSAAACDLLAEKAKRTSVLFVPSFTIDYTKLARFGDAIPFTVKSNRQQEVLVVPDVSDVVSSEPVMRLSGDVTDVQVWNQQPPIYRTEMFVEPAANATVLAQVKIGSASIDEPLIIKSERSGVRSLAITGYGLYRWKLLGKAQAAARGASVQDVLQSFIGNSVKWLSVRDDEKRVEIRSSHEYYAVGEQVRFSASVLDQSFSVVDDAEVRIDISGPQGQRRITASSIGNGRYSANASMLPPGDYSYRGTAVSRGVEIGSDNGRFTVGDLGIEESATTLNSSLLRVLAQRSGGVFANVQQIDSLLDALQDDKRLLPIARTSDREYALYHLPWFIAIALSAFATEWLIRKRKGLV